MGRTSHHLCHILLVRKQVTCSASVSTREGQGLYKVITVREDILEFCQPQTPWGKHSGISAWALTSHRTSFTIYFVIVAQRCGEWVDMWLWGN